MRRSFNFGLIQDHHLNQLFLLMDHAATSFKKRPETAGLFRSLARMLAEESTRRHTGKEREQFFVEWKYDCSGIHPVSLMYCMDFFRKKAREYAEQVPPVQTFFKRVCSILEQAVEQYVTKKVQRMVRKQQTEASSRFGA